MNLENIINVSNLEGCIQIKKNQKSINLDNSYTKVFTENSNLSKESIEKDYPLVKKISSHNDAKNNDLKNFNKKPQIFSSKFIFKKLNKEEISNKFNKYCSIKNTTLNISTENELYLDKNSDILVELNILKKKKLNFFINKDTTIEDLINYINKSNYLYFQEFTCWEQYQLVDIENGYLINNKLDKIYKNYFQILIKNSNFLDETSSCNSHHYFENKKKNKKIKNENNNLILNSLLEETKNIINLEKVDFKFSIKCSINKKKFKDYSLIIKEKSILLKIKKSSIFNKIFAKIDTIKFNISNINSIEIKKNNQISINVIGGSYNLSLLIESKESIKILKIFRLIRNFE